jgi:hypothetical protein
MIKTANANVHKEETKMLCGFIGLELIEGCVGEALELDKDDPPGRAGLVTEILLSTTELVAALDTPIVVG